MKRNLPKTSFWITNYSNRNVSLSDLRLSVPAHRSMNLLDDKHFSYTLEQLEASAKDGSLFNKRHLIIVRVDAPQIVVRPGVYISKEPRYVAPRSAITLEEKVYEELLPSPDEQTSEEKFADEFSGEELLWNPLAPANLKK
ncbi:MAG TPA: hypothetical protein VM577_07300, partial [Anaerovoracaceae bacterium]|nr:hypothetical protein [Anaerovoracaceae bacterium]